jgi:NADH dehydrogenase [ubiquinone] 1 alpha subcomplex assembly factor 7
MADDTAPTKSPLEAEIRKLIGIAGPMPIAQYMRLCLAHPQYGYYIKGDPLGSGGDFITAPEISQMFGEIIGLWLASVWQQLGAPENVRLIELGPGRGSMLIDALRAAKGVPGFHSAVVLHLVEISPALQTVQERRLEPLGLPMLWHTALEQVPPGPCLIVANEFIDALPIHQAVKQSDGWHERGVIIGPDGNFAIGAMRDPLAHFEATLPAGLRLSPEGSIFEWRSDDVTLEIGRRVRKESAALIIDYGHAWYGLGETLQAVSGHTFADPLRSPGEVDLTAHVDFQALAQVAESIGGRVHGPVAQRDWLRRLGIDQRAATLKAHAPYGKSNEIDQALSRLTASGARGMGDLCKVMAIADPKLRELPGFETS